jgi:hypothetical protein
MVLWSLVAAGAAADGAEDDLRARLADVLADPRYGAGVCLLAAGCGSPAAVVAAPARLAGASAGTVKGPGAAVVSPRAGALLLP